MELAEHLLKKETDEGKVECINEAFRLCRQVTLGYGLGEPYYLVLDNDVLNALQKPNIHSVRYIAIILLFRTIKKLDKDFKIAISPAIFLEFNNEKAFESPESFENGWAFIRKTVAQTELPIYSYGLDTFKMAKAQYKSIKHDIKAINASLDKINSRVWKVNLRRDFGVTFPHVVAREECPKIKVKYFSHHHTQRFLESVIESKIVHHKDNDSYARKNFRHEGSIKKSKLLENKKGRLKGVGDLSLLSLCDIASQFHYQSKSTSIALTFDKRLERTLFEHSAIAVHSQEFLGGKEDESSIKEKMTDFIERGKIVTDINKEAQMFIEAFADELKNTEWLRSALQAGQPDVEPR